ncbi:MAG: beta-N-acetylhexosaminidase [Wenzhouxiangellaceae bacterium]|nr:beta-N-acetylhexosaminidase [Wenzhouxiangellaceae bacterium]MBS3746343.1 beta-N-acetylhexosaminidase [Wenzhouxiangellaceae bacterium]
MRTGLVVGIEGHALDARARAVLKHPAVVGVILFSRNYRDPEQLAGLCREIRALREPRLLICVDQEGGRVQRFASGFTRLPPLGRLGNWYRSHPDRALDLAYRHGRIMAAEVLGHGADLSLAPVLDLDRGSEVIGDRAFSDDPEAVLALAGHYIAGMRDAGMKNCGKHFPGHGSVRADSHLEVVTDSRTRHELAADIAPFAGLAGQLDAVMPAHVRYPCVDDRPAGFSGAWIEGILGAELDFRGVVLSDDLDMNGAGVVGDLRERWGACETAGCDLALVCDPRSAADLLSGEETDEAGFQAARAAAAKLFGRASFSLAEQELVSEFRAWKHSLNQLAGA